MRLLLALAAAASLLTACASPPRVHPAPFTADQLRAATRVGRTYVYLVQAEGKPPILREMRFTRADADRAEVVTTIKDETGKVVEVKPAQSAAWTELRSHGEFPEDRVTTAEGEARVPAGTFKVTIYTVRKDEGRIDRFEFARDLPGPPVAFSSEKAGKRVMTSTLIEYREGPPPP